MPPVVLVDPEDLLVPVLLEPPYSHLGLQDLANLDYRVGLAVLEGPEVLEAPLDLGLRPEHQKWLELY